MRWWYPNLWRQNAKLAKGAFSDALQRDANPQLSLAQALHAGSCSGVRSPREQGLRSVPKPALRPDPETNLAAAVATAQTWMHSCVNDL